MHLDEYIIKARISPRMLAELIGISVPYLYMIRKGDIIPRPLVAECIERVTEGVVTKDEILNGIKKKNRRKVNIK